MTAWIFHCLDMLAVAFRAANTASERRILRKAAYTRLLQPINWTPYRSDLVAMNPIARARMLSRFDAAAALRADLGPAGRGSRPACLGLSAFKYMLSRLGRRPTGARRRPSSRG